ncbi:hypothetical protein D3C76_1036550 [compost metagenome]
MPIMLARPVTESACTFANAGVMSMFSSVPIATTTRLAKKNPNTIRDGRMAASIKKI